VPYDPNIYFHGEEITVALRAYTWGYDLFHPTEVLSWHYYIRKEHPRHWTDHIGSNGGTSWPVLDRASRRRVNNLLRYPTPGRFGVGPVRLRTTRPTPDVTSAAAPGRTRPRWMAARVGGRPRRASTRCSSGLGDRLAGTISLVGSS